MIILKMVKNYHNKTLRYCRHCNQRHPENGACKVSLKDSKINKTRKCFRYFSRLDQCIFDQYENQKDEIECSVKDMIKHSYKKYKQTKKKKQRRSQPRRTDYYIRNDKKLKPVLPIQECPVCFIEKKVKVLGCNHSLCTDCWDSIINSESCTDTCPTCRSNLFNTENYYNYNCLYDDNCPRYYRLERLEWNETPSYNMLVR